MITLPDLTLTHCEIGDCLCSYQKVGVVTNGNYIPKAVCVGCFYMHTCAELAGWVFGEEESKEDDKS